MWGRLTKYLIPWRRVDRWMCISCGECCSRFTVPLQMYEVIFFLHTSPWALTRVNGRVMLEERDGRCAFQSGRCCGIQEFKPKACKLFPFYLLDKPLREQDIYDTIYIAGSQAYYVYIHRMCSGLGVGYASEKSSQR